MSILQNASVNCSFPKNAKEQFESSTHYFLFTGNLVRCS